MSFLVVGLNHQTASLSVREQFAFPKEKIPEILEVLKQKTQLAEFVLLSTCNRTEIYAAAEHSDILIKVLPEIAKDVFVPQEDIWYVYHEEAALQHLVQVATGLNSMILGEPQILGQVKEAYDLAVQAGMVGKVLHRMFQQAFFLSKKIRHETDIGKNPVSVAYAAVNLAKHIFADLAACKILMLGAGETIELAAKHFSDQGAKTFYFVNRSLENALKLAHYFHASAFELTELETLLPEADIIVAATDSPDALITCPMFQRVVEKHHGRAWFLLDLAVPRNIVPDIANLPDCYLYSIDDLQSIVFDSFEQRQEAAKIAQEIVELEVDGFFRKQKIAIYGEEIKKFTDNVDKMIEQFVQEAGSHTQVKDVMMLGKKLAKRVQHEALEFFREGKQTD